MPEQIEIIKEGVVINSKIKTATRFVVLIGFVSLFADMTYEAARSINGPYLNILGTTGTTVGVVAGLGELFGYALRIISGYLSDRTHKYWTFVIIGYVLNLISVPLLAWAGYWQLAIILIIGERIGKAIRNPSRDAMLSFASKEMGRGWAFGLHDALDSTGATIGPLLVSGVLFFQHQSYKEAYLTLFIPAIIAVSILLFAKSLFPHPENLEIKVTTIETKGYPKLFWFFLLAAIFIAAGYADFSLIAFHFKKTALMNDAVIPLLYAAAMFTEGVSALLLGKLFDKAGLKIVIISIVLSLAFAPMVFWGNLAWAIAGMIAWGIGMGMQESLLKAIVSQLIPSYKRGRAFGLFHMAFGVFWFLGSALMGYLYDVSLTGLIVFSVATQIISVILFLFFASKFNKSKIILQ
jgi:MFS family permease